MGFFVALVLEILVALILAIAYFFAARKVKSAGRLEKFINFFLVFGAGWGITIAAIYEREQLDWHPVVFWLHIGYFIVQLAACIIFLRNKKLGAVLLILTFLFQLPILHGANYEYFCQTLVSFRVDLSSIKPYDVELGSYLFYINMHDYRMNEDPGWGLNLVPVFFIAFYMRRLFRK